MGCGFRRLREYVFAGVAEVLYRVDYMSRCRAPATASGCSRGARRLLEAGDRRFGAVFELVDSGTRGAFAFRVEVEVQVGLSLYADATPHGDAVGRWALGVGLG